MSEQITKKIKTYINKTIRPPREEFGGLPTCPFAGPELDAGRLMIDVIAPGEAPLPELINKFLASDKSSALFAQVTDEKMSAYDTKRYQRFINALLKKMGAKEYKCICFNPNDTITSVDGFNARALAPYFLINIADKKELGRAHKTLMKTRYFDKLNETYLKYLHVDPKSLNKSECASSKKRT